MANTFNDIWRELSMYNTDIPPQLIQGWVKEAFTAVRDAKLWSWAVEEDQFETILAVSTGDLTVTNGSTAIVATTSPFVAGHVGLQVKIDGRVFTIASQSDANNAVLDRSWPADTGTQSGTVLTAYVAAPSDFYGFISVIDTGSARRLWTNVSASRLDFVDPKRVSTGAPTVLADRKWRTTPSSAATVPMYELWPHPTTLRGMRLLYWKIHPDFSKSQALPYTIPDRIIKNYALSRMSMWPGDNKNPNRMHSRVSAKQFRDDFDEDLQTSIIQDDEIFDTDFWLDTKMADQFGPIGRTEPGPFPSLRF